MLGSYIMGHAFDREELRPGRFTTAVLTEALRQLDAAQEIIRAEIEPQRRTRRTG